MLRRLALALFAALALVGGVAVATAVATTVATAVRAQNGDNGAEIEKRKQWLRDLPKEERARLKAALEKFRSLPQAERQALRERAAKLGPDRLEGLAGRDLGQLARRRSTLDVETDHVLAQIGQDRLQGLRPEERAYVRAMAVRGFQWHIRRRLLNLQTYAQWEQIVPEERSRRLKEAIDRTVDERIARLPDEERERILRLPRKQQGAERAKLLADFRMDETAGFSRIFERYTLEPLLAAEPAERAQRVRRWREHARWTETVRVLREDLGIGVAARRDLAALGPADWAKVMALLQQPDSGSVDERRARIEAEIHRLAGERALSPAGRRPRVPLFLEKLRERRLVRD